MSTDKRMDIWPCASLDRSAEAHFAGVLQQKSRTLTHNYEG